MACTWYGKQAANAQLELIQGATSVLLAVRALSRIVGAVGGRSEAGGRYICLLELLDLLFDAPEELIIRR